MLQQITPNPLISAVVQLRLEDSIGVQEKDFFPKVYEKINNFLPQISMRNSGNEHNFIILDSTAEQYYPFYIFKNDEYALSFAEKAIAFEIKAPYTSWPKFYQFIQETLCKISNFLTKKVVRIGVRYINVFDKSKMPSFSKAEDILVLPKISTLSSYQETMLSSNFYLEKDNNIILIKIEKEVEAKSWNQQTIYGPYLDIDSIFAYTESESELSKIIEKINDLHNIEKEIFVQMINPSYLERLNPKYN